MQCAKLTRHEREGYTPLKIGWCENRFVGWGVARNEYAPESESGVTRCFLREFQRFFIRMLPDLLLFNPDLR